MTLSEPTPDVWCSVRCAWSGEPMAGTAPRADTWLVVEEPGPWGGAALTRGDAGVRVILARPARGHERPPQAWVGRAAGSDPALHRIALSEPAEVADWELAEIDQVVAERGERVEGPLLLVCANGRRDRCCGHLGGALARELATDPYMARHLLTSTHLGGHRFAPTALVLPWGVLHGRLDRDRAQALFAAAEAGRTPVESLRGHSTLAPPAQVAEVHARRVTGFDGIAPLPVEVAVNGDRATATVTVPGRGGVAVVLRREVSDVLPSCGRGLEPTGHWTAAD